MSVDLTRKFHSILAGGWRQRYVIVVPILLMPPLGGLVGSVTPERYQNHTTILLQEPSKFNPLLSDLAISARLEERYQGLKAMLLSRHILSKVAQDLGRIDKDSGDAERDRAINSLKGSLSVAMIGDDMIKLTHTAGSNGEMKRVLELVSKHFQAQLLAPEMSAVAKSERFLDQQIKSLGAQIEEAEQGIAEYKSAHFASLPQMHAGNVQRLKDLEQRLAEKQSELAGAEEEVESFKRQFQRTNPVIGHLEEQIVQTQSDLAVLRARYTDNHSRVQAAIRKIERLEQERQHVLSQAQFKPGDSDRLWDLATGSGMRSLKGDESGGLQTLLITQLDSFQSARTRFDGLTREVERLQEVVEELRASTVHFGESEKEYKDLTRNIEVKRNLYEELLRRRERARVTGSLGLFEFENRIKVIDEPFTPTYAVNLPLVIYVIGGLFAGGGLGVGLAVILELIDGSIRSRRVMEEIASAPVLTRVPQLGIRDPDAKVRAAEVRGS